MVTSESGTPGRRNTLPSPRPRFNGGEWEMVFDPDSGDRWYEQRRSNCFSSRSGFAEILSAMTPARRLRTARGIDHVAPDSEPADRQADVAGGVPSEAPPSALRLQAGIGFVWQGEERRLRNWRATRGSRGRMPTGFDEGEGRCVLFYRADIERHLDISFNETRRHHKSRSDVSPSAHHALSEGPRPPSRGERGFTGVAARIARVHQYGLRDRVNDSGAMASYPRRTAGPE